MVVAAIETLRRVQQKIQLIRHFGDVSKEIELNEKETCGLMWELDSWSQDLESTIDKLYKIT